MPEGRLLEIGEAARRLAMSAEHLRRLADRGAVPVAVRTASGRRLFDPAAIESLRQERAKRGSSAQLYGTRSGRYRSRRSSPRSVDG
jgi:hypothetical protein